MKQLYVPVLLINLMMYIVGIVIGISPNALTIHAPSGYILQIKVIALTTTLIGSIMTIGALIGIQILGSGLSDTSATIILKGIIYCAAWLIFSGQTAPLLNLIPTVGIFIYLILSLLYGIGVFLELAELGSGSTGGNIEKGGGGGKPE